MSEERRTSKVRNRLRRVLSVIAIAGISISAVAFSAGAYARRTVRSANPPPGQMVDVQGRFMHINCQGQGDPTVVLDARLMDFSVLWAGVQAHVATFTRVCSYDRRGLGWSEPGSLPRSSAVAVTELKDLLDAAHIAPPYILAGHSYGGMNARRFAQRYPKLVAGLVLVDAAHVGQIRRIPELDSARTATARQFRLLARFNALGMLAVAPGTIPARGLSAEPARQYRSVLASTSYFPGALSELDAMEASFAPQSEDTVTLNDLPVVVVSRGRAALHPEPNVTMNEHLEKEWQLMQREVVALFPRSTQVVARESGHDIHVHEPAVVSNAIHAVFKSNARR